MIYLFKKFSKKQLLITFSVFILFIASIVFFVVRGININSYDNRLSKIQAASEKYLKDNEIKLDSSYVYTINIKDLNIVGVSNKCVGEVKVTVDENLENIFDIYFSCD